MDDHVDRFGDELRHALAAGFLDQHFDPSERGFAIVGVKRREPAGVPRVPALEKRERLGAPHLADDDAVGTESKRAPKESVHRDRAFEGAEGHLVLERALKLAGVLDEDDAIVWRFGFEVAKKGVDERRLPGPGAADDEDVPSLRDRGDEQAPLRRR